MFSRCVALAISALAFPPNPLLAVGRSAQGIFGALGHSLEIIKDLDYKRFVDKGWEDRIPLVGIPLSLLKDQGIYEGNKFPEFLSELQRKQPRNYYRYTVFENTISPTLKFRALIVEGGREVWFEWTPAD